MWSHSDWSQSFDCLFLSCFFVWVSFYFVSLGTQFHHHYPSHHHLHRHPSASCHMYRHWSSLHPIITVSTSALYSSMDSFLHFCHNHLNLDFDSCYEHRHLSNPLHDLIQKSSSCAWSLNLIHFYSSSVSYPIHRHTFWGTWSSFVWHRLNHPYRISISCLCSLAFSTGLNARHWHHHQLLCNQSDRSYCICLSWCPLFDHM